MDAWFRKIPWRRKWQPTLLFLPGKSHEHTSLAGYSPWGRKDSDMTEQLNNNSSHRKMPSVHQELKEDKP